MWCDRYNIEVQQHTKTSTGLLQTKSDLKDALIEGKSFETKLTTANRHIQMLQDQTVKQQHELNESDIKIDSLTRELDIQHEIMK
jgi:predicted RNase H-like nuclease (RuvC/YqgF family)